MRRWAAVFVCVALVFGVAAGCARKSGAPGVEAPKIKRLVFGLGSEPARLDPQDATDNPSYMATEHIYEKLVDFDEKMDIHPKLAESWEVKDEGLTWVFHLKKGVKFHDGTPFDAQAVKANFDRVLNPDNKLARHGLYAPYVDRVEAPDEFTVVFRLKQPFGALLAHLAHSAGGIISPAALEKYGKDIARNPVGTGPFKFKEWAPGDHITLVRNEEYWGTKPKLDELVFRPIPEGASRVMALETGEVDVAYPVPATEVERLKGNPGLKVVVTPTLRVIYVGIKVTQKPFDNVKVRQALNYAVDKKAIVDTVLRGLAQVADSPLSPLTWGYSPTYTYAYDPEKAKQLLQEAGVKPGTRVKLWTPEGRYLMDRQTAEVVQNNLQAVGLEVDFQKWEWAAYLDELDKKQESPYELFLLGWAPSTGDADWGLRPLLGTDMADNNALYSNPGLDKMLADAAAESDRAKRKALYADIQKLIMDEAPWIFLHVMHQTVGIRQGVEGVFISPLEMIMFHAADKQ
ncbi:MAG: glutathione ABC transporter substrate-binding protein [Bacillota bacterium]|nr:glutathione ABC transporter substrate-binding protein [Bacillota bacterium]